MRLDTIVGYVFDADTFCPDCIIGVLPTGRSEQFDGWALAADVLMPAEENLDEIAHAFGFDRTDESTFDSGDFPKVIFADTLDGDDRCGACAAPLGGEHDGG